MMAKQLITERVLKDAQERARSGDYCDCYTIRERNLTLSLVLLARVSEILSLSLFSFYMLEIAQDFAVDAISLGLIFSVQVVFTGIGGLVFGILGDYFGRKRTLMIILTVSSFGSAMTAFSPNIAILVVARTIVGLGCGGEWGIGMSMLNEICHKKVRGLVSGLIQGAYPLGMTGCVSSDDCSGLSILTVEDRLRCADSSSSSCDSSGSLDARVSDVARFQTIEKPS